MSGLNRLTRLPLIVLMIAFLTLAGCGGGTQDSAEISSEAAATVAQEAETGSDLGEGTAADPTAELPAATESPAEPTANDAVAENFTIAAQGIGQQGTTASYAFTLQNPNTGVAFNEISFDVFLQDAAGAVVAEDSGFVTSLLPGQTLGLGGSVTVAEGVTVAAADIQLSEGTAVTTTGTKNFTVDKVLYFPGEQTSVVTGLITSPFDRPFDDIRVSAITYDAAGAINGGGYTFINFIPTGSQIGAAVYVTSSSEVASVELHPAVSILSLQDVTAGAPEGAESMEFQDFGYGSNDFNAGYGIMVRNPNPDYAIEFGKYRVTAFDASGNVVGTDEGYIDLVLPGQTLGIGGSLYPQTGQLIDSMEAWVIDGTYVAATDATAFTTENATFVADEFFPQVTGNVSNPNTTEKSGVRVSALAYNAEDEIIGGGFAFLDAIPAQGSAPASVGVTVSGQPTRVELYASASALTDNE